MCYDSGGSSNGGDSSDSINNTTTIHTSPTNTTTNTVLNKARYLIHYTRDRVYRQSLRALAAQQQSNNNNVIIALFLVPIDFIYKESQLHAIGLYKQEPRD